MHVDAQRELAHTLMGYVDAATTYSAGASMANPVTAYSDVDRWQRERTALFRRHPVVVGLSSQLSQPGDWLTFDLPDLPLLVVRGEDRRARCFVNACRHRAVQLATEACGHSRSLVCPFHGWSYRLDGSLLAIPDAAGFPGLDPTAYGLKELPCSEQFGMIWLDAERNGDPRGEPRANLDAHLGGELVEELASYGLHRYHHFRSTTIPVVANWKLMYDTFLEFYHGTYLHKATLAHLMLRNLVHFDRVGEHWRMAAAKKSLLTLRDQPPEAWRVLDHAVVSYDIYPNLAINFHGDHVAVYRILPGAAVGNSLWHFSLLTPEPVVGEKAERYFTRNFDYIVGTGQDDVAMAESIERTLRSGAQDTVCYGGFEPVLAWYHSRLAAEFATELAG